MSDLRLKLKKFFKEAEKGAVSLQSMGDVALTIGISIVIIVAVAKIIVKMQETETSQTSLAYNISQVGLQAIKDLVDWFPILVVVIVAVLVIYLITGGFGGKRRR